MTASTLPQEHVQQDTF